MPHYVCTGGCGGVSSEPGVCQSEDCVKHNQPLIECDCTDERHEEAFDKEENDEEEEKDIVDNLENL